MSDLPAWSSLASVTAEVAFLVLGVVIIVIVPCNVGQIVTAEVCAPKENGR